MKASEVYREHLAAARTLLEDYGMLEPSLSRDLAIQLALAHATVAVAAAVRGLDGTMMAAHDVNELF